MAGKITGRIEVLLNGELLLNKAGAKASGIGISGQPNFELKRIVGDSGGHGYVEEPRYLSCFILRIGENDVRGLEHFLPPRRQERKEYFGRVPRDHPGLSQQ